ncbi:hypothetical protein CH76_03700 [Lysinibacillus sp. BF-4]|uniref:flagellar filament capping protein FliD n=1 Tax=Lysinibacillus sp. BF-4 TaxID=1473546 RepID=UPI000503EAB5|nr:flagellar filament capping protein FliD [Lysinibacillus sp. BF-4]KFL43939.1 hypothetical protein CH76_03700 [Lysinibacillus sp. BF-4]
MVMRMGGLASGMDIDALVEKLMKAERIPLDKTFQKKQTYEWQRDSYRGVNAKLKTFDTYLFDNMILSGKMNQKSATSSNSDLVSVTAKGNASGNISIGGVSQLATSAQAVGSQTGATGQTKLSELGITDSSISLRAIGADGNLAEKATTINFNPATDTVNDLMKKINESGAGVTAVFESGKLSLSAKNMGKAADGAGEIINESNNDVFSKLGFGSDNVLASNGQNAKFEVNGIQTERSSNTFTISGYELTLKQTFNAGNVAQKQLADVNEKLAKANDRVTAFEADVVTANAARDSAQTAYTDARTVAFDGKPDLETFYDNTDKNVLKALTDEDITALGNLAGKTGADVTAAIEAMTDSPEKTKLAAMNVADVEKLATHSGELQGLKDLAEKEQAFNVADTAATAVQANLTAAQADIVALTSQKAEAEDFAAKNPATGTTVAPVTMKASSDTKAAVEQITEFVDKYNEMIEDFGGQLKETKYRDYKPLTKEQREDMSENEQKLWDEKAKSGMLRNDQTIREGMSKMRMTFMAPVAGLGDDTLNSLAKIGITTSGKLSDNGKLEIDKDKLEAALAKDPDQVHRLFAANGEVKETTDANGNRVTEDTRGIAWRLRDAMKGMTNEIEKKAGKDGAVNNTFGLGKKIVESDDRITKLQAKMKDIEARYWKQFTAMEKAIQKANEQSGMFAQFGQ